MEENKNLQPTQGIEEALIDWAGVLAKLLKHWKQIFVICFVFGVLGIVAALTMKRQYTVSLSLAPELQNRSNGSLSNLASMLSGGALLQLAGGTDALNVTLFPEICKSTPFLATLLDVPLESYVPPKMKKKGVKPEETTVYEHISKKSALGKWLESHFEKEDEEANPDDPSELTRKQLLVIEDLARNIIADVDKKTGVVKISVTLDDPRMVKQLADTVCANLQAYVIDYRTRKAKADYEYYVTLADEAKENYMKAQAAYAASVDYDRSVILQSANAEKDRLREEMTLANQIYSQMAQQRELARAKIQEEKPAYAIVQPSVFPRRPDNSRKSVVLIWGFVGLFLAVAWYGFGEDYLKKARADFKEKMREAAE